MAWDIPGIHRLAALRTVGWRVQPLRACLDRRACALVFELQNPQPLHHCICVVRCVYYWLGCEIANVSGLRQQSFIRGPGVRHRDASTHGAKPRAVQRRIPDCTSRSQFPYPGTTHHPGHRSRNGSVRTRLADVSSAHGGKIVFQLLRIPAAEANGCCRSTTDHQRRAIHAGPIRVFPAPRSVLCGRRPRFVKDRAESELRQRLDQHRRRGDAGPEAWDAVCRPLAGAGGKVFICIRAARIGFEPDSFLVCGRRIGDVVEQAAVTRTRRLLPLILLIAAAVRLWGIGFGLPYIIARPDETAMAGPAVGFLSGDLRPPYFEWPTLFTYVTALLY